MQVQYTITVDPTDFFQYQIQLQIPGTAICERKLMQFCHFLHVTTPPHHYVGVDTYSLGGFICNFLTRRNNPPARFRRVFWVFSFGISRCEAVCFCPPDIEFFARSTIPASSRPNFVRFIAFTPPLLAAILLIHCITASSRPNFVRFITFTPPLLAAILFNSLHYRLFSPQFCSIHYVHIIKIQTWISHHLL